MMQFFNCIFLGVAMLIVCTFAAPLSEEMQALEERNKMQALEERNKMQALEERSYMHERGPEQCQAPWKAVNGFQKCYLFQSSDDEHVQYLDANKFCINSKSGARLFTPGSLDEMTQVEKALAEEGSTYWTGYVEFAWQEANPKGPLQYAANAYPFEPMPQGMWTAGQPNDFLPQQEPCTCAGSGTIGDCPCIETKDHHWFQPHTILCEFAWTLTPAWKTTRREANMMHNAQERGQANLMHNAQERGQANLMHNAQERGQANPMHNAEERGQANLMHNAQERGQANLMHNAEERQ